ncbi:MAG: radical SAM protein, partial [Deltaproteobacteria bacterium]
MPSGTQALSPLEADLLLLHPPAVFDFRGRRDLYLPFMGTSGDVPITPLYEYFPVGFKTLQRFLGDRGHGVRLLNLASLLLRYPHLDVDQVIEALDVGLLGIDLHWLVHVQGSLAIAQRVKRLRPDLPIIFGGISATYFAAELMATPDVDMVMVGYDTHEPMDRLLRALRAGQSPSEVPNLWWKDRDGSIRQNGFSHQPRTFGCGIDWSSQPEAPAIKGLPIREILTTQNAGCAHDCTWCGGSNQAFRRINHCDHGRVHKSIDEVNYELGTLSRRAHVGAHHLYTVGAYNQSDRQLGAFLDGLAKVAVRSVSIEQFYLPPDELLTRLAAANHRCTITLSPLIHDVQVAKLAGRGVYTNDEMEAWIDRALAAGIHGVDIWYFIGMPEQTDRLVFETIDYCEHLLARFAGANVNPMICPMIPFLDPGSSAFESPDRFGYHVFFRSLEQHRQGAMRASIINRINYETKWLSREALINVGFEAVKRLMEAKASVGMLPRSHVKRHNDAIDDVLEFLPTVHAADCIEVPAER